MSRGCPNCCAVGWLIGGGVAAVLLVATAVGLVLTLADRPAPAVEPPGVIALSGLPPDAVAFVDGRRVAVTRSSDGSGAAEVPVTPGEHTIHVEARNVGRVMAVSESKLSDPDEFDRDTFHVVVAVRSGERRRLDIGWPAEGFTVPEAPTVIEEIVLPDVTAPLIDHPVLMLLPLVDKPAPVTPVAPDGARPIICDVPAPPSELKPANELFAGRRAGGRSQ